MTTNQPDPKDSAAKAEPRLNPQTSAAESNQGPAEFQHTLILADSIRLKTKICPHCDHRTEPDRLTNEPCCLCDSRTEMCGVDFIIGGALVCDQCVQRYAPKLLAQWPRARRMAVSNELSGAPPPTEKVEPIEVRHREFGVGPDYNVYAKQGIDLTELIEQWLAERIEAGRKIDPETAEIERFTVVAGSDPYGFYPPGDGEVGRDWFARSPGSKIWVYFGDLRDATEAALWEKLNRETARGGV